MNNHGNYLPATQKEVAISYDWQVIDYEEVLINEICLGFFFCTLNEYGSLIGGGLNRSLNDTFLWTQVFSLVNHDSTMSVRAKKDNFASVVTKEWPTHLSMRGSI